MDDQSRLSVAVERHENMIIARPDGDIDLSVSPSLRATLADLHDETPDRIIMDLESVDYMDSSGIATLVESMQKARLAGHGFILCRVTERVRTVFEIANLDKIFTITGTVEEARIA